MECLAAGSHVDRFPNVPAVFIQTNIVGTYTPLERPLENHLVLRALPALAEAERVGDELARRALEQKQRQVAVALVMMVLKRQFRLALGSIFEVVHVEHDHLWRHGVVGDKLFDKDWGQAAEVACTGGVFQARERRCAGRS